MVSLISLADSKFMVIKCYINYCSFSNILLWNYKTLLFFFASYNIKRASSFSKMEYTNISNNRNPKLFESLAFFSLMSLTESKFYVKSYSIKLFTVIDFPWTCILLKSKLCKYILFSYNWINYSLISENINKMCLRNFSFFYFTTIFKFFGFFNAYNWMYKNIFLIFPFLSHFFYSQLVQ